MKKVTVTWYVKDGYSGNKRPQNLAVNVEDLRGLDRQQIIDELALLVEEDFSQKVSFSGDYEAAADQILEVLKK